MSVVHTGEVDLSGSPLDFVPLLFQSDTSAGNN